MSDVTDYTNVAAPPAKVLQVINFNPGTTPPQTINLDLTHRSLIFLASIVHQNDFLTVNGNTTGAQYLPGGITSTGSTWGWVVPAYGVADPQVTWSIAGTAGGRQITVIGVPDELPTGTATAPELVRLLDGSGFVTGVANDPLIVELQDSAGNQQGTSTHPLYSQRWKQTVFGALALNDTAAHTLLAAAPAGQVLVVDAVSIESTATGTVIYMGPASSMFNPALGIRSPANATAQIVPVQGPIYCAATDAFQVASSVTASGVIVRGIGHYEAV